MTCSDELRARARALYDLAKAEGLPDEGLLHVLHAIELEAHADQLEGARLERDDIREPTDIDS
jgi:hypothetical protein